MRGRRFSPSLRLLHVIWMNIAVVEVSADQVPKGVAEEREKQLAAWQGPVSST